MQSEEDPLSSDVSVSGEMTETGIKASAKSRAVSAIDRLVGNVVDLANPFLEGIAARQRSKNVSDAEIAKALAKKMVEQIEQSQQPYAAEVIESHLRDVLGKRRNKTAVVEEAITELKMLPTAELEKADERPQVSDDWLAHFSSYAEKASSPAVRTTWAKVLSGEIQKPGAFTFTTLRIISETDAEHARLFQELASRSFRFGAKTTGPTLIIKPTKLVGLTLTRLLHLQSIGLLQEVTGDVGIRVKARDIKENTRLHFVVEENAVIARPISRKPSKFSLKAITLTYAGTQLASVIQADEKATIAALAEEIKKCGWTAKLHQIAKIEGDRLSFKEPGTEL